MDAEDLITQAKGTSPNIKELLDLVKPFQSSHETLSSLHDDLDVLKQVVKTLQEDKDGFLSHNAKYQPKLLEECHHLLKGSKIICSELYGEFKGAMQQSAIWSGVNQHEIQNNVLRNTPILVGLRIWILRLDLTVKFMQFNLYRTALHKRTVENMIGKFRRELQFRNPTRARILSDEFSNIIMICEIAAEAVKEKKELAIAENIGPENDCDITPAPQTAAKSPWIRRPRA